MLFSSLTFLYIFLPILLLIYFLVKTDVAKKNVLIIFSLIFYAWGEPIYVLLMLFVVFINFYFGKKIENAKRHERKKSYLIRAVTLNILILVFFKYTNFLLENLNRILPFTINPLNIALPLGISFYTFQALSYTIDVYRGDAVAQKNYSSLLLYVSFFPQLVAGPIVRYKDIMEQLKNRIVNIDEIFSGAYRFSIGFAKKIIVANSLGRCVDMLLKNTDNPKTVLSMWCGVLFFALQIFFDFAAYSDMAIGLGKIFGFNFKENFNYPFISASITEFWRRWHISLSTFFRDYVYIPLGGNKKWIYRNIIIVWALTGIWHGASWNFLFWGLFYAVFLVIEKMVLIKLLEKFPKFISKIIGIIYTIFLTLIGFTIFYWTNLNELIYALQSMFGFTDLEWNNLFTESIIKENFVLLIIAIIFATPLMKNLFEFIESKFNNSFIIAIKTIIIFVLIFISTSFIVGLSYNPFLYFRF